jgi:mRNA interferase MazF
VRRGDVVALRPSRDVRGHEQRGKRFAIVLQADDLLALSTVIVVPTSGSAVEAVFRPTVSVRRRRTRVLVDQIRAVDRSRLGSVQGHVSAPELAEIERSLAVVLGLF